MSNPTSLGGNVIDSMNAEQAAEQQYQNMQKELESAVKALGSTSAENGGYALAIAVMGLMCMMTGFSGMGINGDKENVQSAFNNMINYAQSQWNEGGSMTSAQGTDLYNTLTDLNEIAQKTQDPNSSLYGDLSSTVAGQLETETSNLLTTLLGPGNDPTDPVQAGSIIADNVNSWFTTPAPNPDDPNAPIPAPAPQIAQVNQDFSTLTTQMTNLSQNTKALMQVSQAEYQQEFSAMSTGIQQILQEMSYQLKQMAQS